MFIDMKNGIASGKIAKKMGYVPIFQEMFPEKWGRTPILKQLVQD
jgi:hypothetical protein